MKKRVFSMMICFALMFTLLLPNSVVDAKAKNSENDNSANSTIGMSNVRLDVTKIKTTNGTTVVYDPANGLYRSPKIFSGYYVDFEVSFSGKNLASSSDIENKLMAAKYFGSFNSVDNSNRPNADKQTDFYVTKAGEYASITIKNMRYSGVGKELVLPILQDDGTLISVPFSIPEEFFKVEPSTPPKPELEKPEIAVETPYVIISGYTYGNEENVTAGDKFTLNLQLRNTSQNIDVTNMILTIETPDSMILTNSSNTIHIPLLQANEAISKSMKVSVKPSSEAESQKITLKMNYQYIGNNERKSFDRVEVITVPVTQLDRFELTSVEIPEKSVDGEEILVTVNYVNKGRSQAFNLSAEIQGEFANPGQKKNLGNLASGATGSTDFYIRPSKTGVLSGEIVMVYEDTNAVEHEQKIQFNTNIEEKFVPENKFPNMPTDPMPEPKKSKWPIYLMVGGAVLVLVVVIVVVKKIRQKRREEEDADL